MEAQTAMDPQELTELEKKHIPVIEIDGTDVLVKIGEITHPMEEDHYIEWIELFIGDKLHSRKNLKAGRKPEAEFHLRGEEVKIYAFAHCNQHGTWKCDPISMLDI